MPTEDPTSAARIVQYRPIDGAPNYRACDDGRFQSFRRGEWRDKAACRRGKGYLVVEMTIGGRSVRRYVAHLVLEAFVGTRPWPGAVARHLDGDKDNNAASNLRWGTLSENVRDSILHGTHGVTKLTPEDVRAIRASDEPPAVIAERFGIAKGYVGSIRSGKNWGWV